MPIVIMGIMVLVVLFIVQTAHKPVSYRCPNDYATGGEYTEGVAKWISEEMKLKPDMTMDNLIQERHRLFDKYHCEESKWLME